MSGRSGIRAFVAIDVPDNARDALERLQYDLPVGRLMAPETFHLTLAFLGDQSAIVLDAVHDTLSHLRADPFPLSLRGVEVFGGRAPRVLWVGAAKHPALTDLRDRVRRAVAAAGVELPRERFRPHVTLARFGQFRGDELERLRGYLAYHAGFALDPFEVDCFKLYSSELHPDGAAHYVICNYPFQMNGS